MDNVKNGAYNQQVENPLNALAEETRMHLSNVNFLINKLYSINYSCLQAGVRGNQYDPSNPYGPDENSWIGRKIGIISTYRNKWIDYISSKDSTIEGTRFYQAFDTFKAYFMENFERVYGPSGSFEDNFDGFNIKHPKFKKDFYDVDILFKVSNKNPEFPIVCFDYLTYLNLYKQQLAQESFESVFSTLVQDVKSNGFKSFFFQKPSKDIYLVTEKEIDEMYEHASRCLKQTSHAKKSTVKKYNRAYKKAIIFKENEKAVQKFFHLNACCLHENNQNVYAWELHKLVSYWKQRMECANTPHDNSLGNSFIEGILDLASGVNIFNEKNNYKTDVVYIHQKEFEYYNYLMNQIKLIQQHEVKPTEAIITQKQQ